MRWKETLYTRRLRRPIDESTREAITSEFSRRRHEIPMAAELRWSASKPEFVVVTQWLSLLARFTSEQLVVDAEMTFAARVFATAENKKTAVRFIESLADDLGL
jgi:hypothetical protein